MSEKFKRLISGISAAAVALTIASPINAFAEAQPEEGYMFNPETVMWTNNPVENVLKKEGIYSTLKEVNPNASNKEDSGVQSPYGKPGETLKKWAYSEYIWTHSYPIGNGRMAGMVAGGIDNEVIQLNEDTCWDGSPYGNLQNENGEIITTVAETNAAQTITTVNQTGGSDAESWRYFRGANADGTPAEIGAADVIVGDEAFRTKYPEFANKSISNQSLNIDNSKTLAAVQNRWSMERMVEETFLGTPTKQRAYKSFVEIYLDFGHSHTNATNYTKSLDMETGIVTVEYDHDGAHFKRETFASYPDQVVVTHVESDKDLNFSAELHTYHSEKDGFYSYEKVSDNEVKVTAAITNGSKDNNGIATVNAIKFEARMFLDGDGSFTVAEDNKTVMVSGGKSANIYVVGATNFVDYLTLDSSKPARDCDVYSANVKSKTYDEIKARHIADFSEQFGKTSLTLENAEGVDYKDTPTEKRVRKDVNGMSGFEIGAASKLATANQNGVYTTYSEGDNQLATLEFNYGKYLIISGSRAGRKATSAGEIDIPGSQPLNLTGKWNAAFSASWNGKYTININTEMNYWAAQPLNIGDSERPLIDTFDELAQSGSITAANQYAIYNDRGDNTYQPGDPWVMHHNYDLWRGTQPIDNATAGLWPTGGVWLLDHAWQYYLFNKDTEYLAEVYPYMVGAAKFFTQFLVVDPETGYLITAASCSPEQGGVQPGPAMDTQLIRNLYDTVQKASEILGKTEENKELLAKIAEQMPSTYFGDEQGKIAPNLIDKAGLIKEWVRGDVTFDISERETGQWKVTNPFSGETSVVYDHGASNTSGHRHCSHLWELFPGTHLSAYSEDENEQAIFKAYQKSTSARAEGSGQGWGLAWRIGLNARALNGEYSSKMLEQLFTTRTSPNLFDQHPNFQIDGNYGATAGMIEMLVQSHDGAITLLPATPKSWESGEFKGFNTREGATVDLAWSDKKPTEAKFHATESGSLSVRSKYVSDAKIYDESGNEVTATLNEDRNLITFDVEEGKTYTMNNFGTSVVEGDRTYLATDVTEFYASDGGSVPKVESSGQIGYIYNRENVKIGYAIEDFDFDGLQKFVLDMAKVRKDDTYVSVTVDSPTGTEIANQIITTGQNELNLKNTDGISGSHKIYVLYYRDPYSNDDKYIANANNVIATYKKTIEKPVSYDYAITSSVLEGGKLRTNVEYSGEGEAASVVLVATSYDKNGAVAGYSISSVKGTQSVTVDCTKPEGGSVKVYLWDSMEGMQPLSAVTVATDAGGNTPTEPPVPVVNSSSYFVTEETVGAAGTVYTDDENLTVSVIRDALVDKNLEKDPGDPIPVMINGVKCCDYIAVATNSTPTDYDTITGTSKGSPLDIMPKKNGKFTLYYRWLANDSRDTHMMKMNEDASFTDFVEGEKELHSENILPPEEAMISVEYGTKTYDLEAGNTYIIFSQGFTTEVFGWTFTPEGASEPVFTPTPSTTPTATPTAEPTIAPTEEPTPTPDPGIFIGETEYETVNAAVAAAAAANPKSEAERVVIDLLPGVYREQVVVNTPYVTIRKKPGTTGEAKITWYYGLGSLYDSCNSSGYYDASAIGDGKSYAPKDWGPALKLNKSANDFIAENITIENSYNIYYTQEELTDITGVDLDTGNSDFHRLEWIQEQLAAGKSDAEINKFLQSRTSITYKGVSSSPRERSAALHTSNDRCQIINCTVISTQDTMGINNGRIYFKDCLLAGTTDYICGSATAVFDNCELLVNAGEGGDSATITAPSNPADSDGYLFYGCHVTGTDLATQGNFGRPWSGINASANYINTKIDYCSSPGNTGKLLIGDAGFTSMGGVEPKDARFHEYGSVDSLGKAVNTSKRVKGTQLNEWTMLRYNPLIFTQGTDGWDPAGLTATYAGVNEVLNTTTIDTSDSTTNVIALPSAPSGYEFYWESNSEFATVSDDQTKLTIVRPANGENPIDASVKLYVRKTDDKEIGGEKSIAFAIQPTSDTENVFTVKGNVTLSIASEEAQTITIEFKMGEAVIKTVEVVVPSGATSAAYTAENIPVGEYTVVPSTANTDYNILTEPASVSGAKGDSKSFDVAVSKMATIVITDADIDNEPAINSANGFSAAVYTATGSESANLGDAGNKVYKLAKKEGTTLAKNIGVSFNIMDMLQDGTSLDNTKTIKFSYDFLLEDIAYMPSDYSYMDLATSTANGGEDAQDQTRFVRTGVHKGWGQLNFFNAMNSRINGDKTQFDKNSTMANKWYRIVTEIDLETKSVIVTAYNRDNNMEVLNGKPFNIAVPEDDGSNPNYPTDVDLNNLYFNIYMDKRANTSNAMEYYIDNISIEYQDFE